ncbi:LysE family transporter [Albimonas sp. CAU 1670]|uniref:LysE family transporter n=1 Tax=Albimonas sp. CAU 1670 TaxID=3032599 RepID=UPI0023DCD006|nr:LysE family transporter [Albimonas sp. CAU 1670]MDF2235064.1 LysE family transporter [Albimonas sp. CAU 1670]
MTTDIWIALAAANFAASVAPGQNVAFVGAATARSGLAGGAAAIGGILAAEAAWTVLAVGLILKARAVEPELLLALQAAGGAALIWCGWRALRSAVALPQAVCGLPPLRARLAAEGLWVGLANPLALMFFVSLLPSLLGGGAAALGPRETGLCIAVVVASSAAALTPYLAVSTALVQAGLARGLNLISAASLLVVGAFAVSRALA